MKGAPERIIERVHRFIRQAQKIATPLPGIECLQAAVDASLPALVAALLPNGTATLSPGCVHPPRPHVLFHLKQWLSVIKVSQVGWPG